MTEVSNPYAPPKASLTLESESTPLSLDTPVFLYISVPRLIILSIASFGLYETYWVYKNWSYIKTRESLNIQPFWRGMFSIFFVHSLFKKIHNDLPKYENIKFIYSPNGLATGFVILVIFASVLGQFHIPFAGVISSLIPSYLCLVPIQKQINHTMKSQTHGVKFYPWSSGHIVCIVYGCIFWSLILVSLIGSRLR